jgi:hypothetical protein
MPALRESSIRRSASRSSPRRRGPSSCEKVLDPRLRGDERNVVHIPNESLIQLSNSQVFQTNMRHHPYCLARPRVGPSPFTSSLPPHKCEGDGAPSDATIVLSVPVFPLENTGRLSARHRGVFLTAPGRAFRWPFMSETAIRQPAPGGRLLLATRRSPGAARVRALRKSTRAGAASCSTIKTPLDDTPR